MKNLGGLKLRKSLSKGGKMKEIKKDVMRQFSETIKDIIEGIEILPHQEEEFDSEIRLKKLSLIIALGGNKCKRINDVKNIIELYRISKAINWTEMREKTNKILNEMIDEEKLPGAEFPENLINYYFIIPKKITEFLKLRKKILVQVIEKIKTNDEFDLIIERLTN